MLASWVWVGGSLLGACSDEAFVHEELWGRITTTDFLSWPRSVQKYDLLLVIDNSPAMEGLGDPIEKDIGILLRQLAGALCLPSLSSEALHDFWEHRDPFLFPDSVITPDDDGYCPPDTHWSLPRELDLRVGVISSSLGGPGCAAARHGNDGARLMPLVRPELPRDDPAGILSLSLRGGGLEGLESFISDVTAHVRAVGTEGCRLQAPLEAVRRFVTAEPDPRVELEPFAGVPSGDSEEPEVDPILDAQRAALLGGYEDRAKLLFMIGATDDCSLRSDLDLDFLTHEALGTEGASACQKLVEGFPDDPRHPVERYYSWEWNTFGVTHPNCAGGRWCSFDASFWLIPAELWWSSVARESYDLPTNAPRQARLLHD